MSLPEFEIRYAASGAGIEVDGRVLRGHAVVFNSLSRNLGGFVERILPSAVDRVLQTGADVRALVDHDTSRVLGRTTAGTLTLRKDRDGLLARIDPPDTSYARDLMVSIERGDISGMSFGFKALKDDWRMEDGIPVREISDMEIREVSVVTFPAYDTTDVSLALRSLDAFKQANPLDVRRRLFAAKGR